MNFEQVDEKKKSIRHNQLEPISVNTPSSALRHGLELNNKGIKTNSANNKQRTLLQKNKHTDAQM